MTVKLLFNDLPQWEDGNGVPYSGGLLFTYTAGSTTKQNTYQDSAGSTANSNPIVLDSTGRVPFAVWGTTGVSYKLVLAPATDTDPPTSPIFTIDNVTPINDTAITVDQWVSGPAPTYVSATSFTLVGDQTTTFHVGRRLKTTNTAGTIYSTILTSVYTSLTTITVVNDSGTLDSGLSAVSYGILSASNPSTPLLADTYPVVSGSVDNTKKIRLEADGITTGTTRVWAAPDYNIAPGKYPTQQKFTTGSGTYTTPAGATYIRVRLVGGGGGGGGNGTSGQTSGGTGGDTTFSTFTASGGVGGGAADGSGTGAGGAGGAASGGNVNIAGTSGGTGTGSPGTNATGGSGASSALGGGTGQTAYPNTASNGATNSGAGGSGRSGNATVYGSGGGGSGGYVEALVTAPAATYSYAVGGVGTAGNAGTSGNAGGVGAAGIIIVDEFYS